MSFRDELHCIPWEIDVTHNWKNTEDVSEMEEGQGWENPHIVYTDLPYTAELQQLRQCETDARIDKIGKKKRIERPESDPDIFVNLTENQLIFHIRKMELSPLMKTINFLQKLKTT